MDSLFTLLLTLLSGLAWTAVYILIIRRNSLEKTYGMPLVALGLNVTWELIFAFIIRPAKMDDTAWLWLGINAIWFLLDVAILVQTIKYGIKEDWPSRQFFYGTATAVVMFGLMGQLAVTFQFQDWEGRWTAFPGSLIMSILFVVMLYKRGVGGQSIYIALFRLIGTFTAGIGYLITDHPASPLQWYLTISILLFDVFYTAMLYRKLRALSINPWTRL